MTATDRRRRLLPVVRLIHYWWPIAMAASIAAVVSRATARRADVAGLALFFCGVAAAYSLDRVFEGRGRLEPRWLRRALTLMGLAATVLGAVLVTQIPRRAALLVPLLGGVVLGYPRLKRIPVLKTVVVSMAWTWTAIALPFPDGSWLGWQSWSLPVALPLTLSVAAACLLCDLKDLDRDRRAAVASLPARAGVAASVRTAAILAAAGAAASLLQHRFGLATADAALTLAAFYPEWVAREAVGPLAVDVILTVPGLMIALHLV